MVEYPAYRSVLHDDEQHQKINDSRLTTEGNEHEDDALLISIDEAIERLGMGKFQYMILFASGLCFAADAMQVILMSFLALVLQNEWGLNKSETASVTSLLFAGAMFGTLVLGPLADRLGRRPVFLIAAFIISVFGFLTSLATNSWVLMVTVLGIGFGVGGLTIPFDLLSEFLPSQGRGVNLLLIEYFWTIGCLYVVVVAFFTLHDGRNHWRIFIALCSLPCFLAMLVGYFYVPESARWLSSEGRRDDAMKVLRDAAYANGLDMNITFPEGMGLIPEKVDKEATLADLLKPQWREITVRLCSAWAFSAFGYYGAILTITKVFEESKGTSSNTRQNDYGFDYSAIFVSSAAELVGTTLVILAVDRVGRISSQVVAYLLAGFFICVLGVLSEQRASRFVLVAAAFLARVFEMSGTCVTWVSTAEILTTEVRTTGHSAANALARMGAFFCPFLVQDNSPKVIGVFMLFVHIFTALCVSKLPETKGKSMGVHVHHLEQDSSDQHAVDSANLDDGVCDCLDDTQIT
jgi:MFS family permease